jgi:hypothetical protein
MVATTIQPAEVRQKALAVLLVYGELGGDGSIQDHSFSCLFGRLIVTGQPAAEVGLLFSMALDAESHEEAVFLESVHGFYLPVTFLTGQFFPNVSLMVEKHVLWKIVYLNPGSWSLGVVVLVLLLNPWKILDNIIMAVKAFLHRRDPGEPGALHIRVTELALDVLHPGMHPVTEGNWLFGTDVRSRGCVKEVEEQSHSKSRK